MFIYRSKAKRQLAIGLAMLAPLAACQSGNSRPVDEQVAQVAPSYYYTAQRQCYCTPDYTKAIRIHVVAGVIDSARYEADNTTVNEVVLKSLFTLEQWQQEIDRITQTKPHRMSVEYQTDGKMLKRLLVDQRKRMADDEYVILFSDFQPE